MGGNENFSPYDIYKNLISLMNLLESKARCFADEVNVTGSYSDSTKKAILYDYSIHASECSHDLIEKCINKGDLDEETYTALAFNLTSSIFRLSNIQLSRCVSEQFMEYLPNMCLDETVTIGHKDEHIYMDNPVWSRPFVKITEADYLFTCANAVYAFPLRILEPLFKSTEESAKLYEATRAEFLEDEVYNILKESLPSARIYKNVSWVSPEDGKKYENDVLCSIGNNIFIFEAKSHDISDPARRGAKKRLERVFKDILVDASRQADRLERYIREYGSNVSLKDDNGPLGIDFERAKVVRSFSVCLEHIPGVVNTKSFRNFVYKGSISDLKQNPLISIGDLGFYKRFLDSEVSFVHFLSARHDLQNIADFDGDEIDTVSAYRHMRLIFHEKDVSDKHLVFEGSRDLAENKYVPRQKRDVLEFIGPELPPGWKKVLRWLYESSSPYFFEISEIVLSNPVHWLQRLWAGSSRELKKLKRGQHLNAYTYKKRGIRCFVCIIHVHNDDIGRDTYVETRRSAANEHAGTVFRETDAVAADIVVVTRSRRGGIWFDYISFFRVTNFDGRFYTHSDAVGSTHHRWFIGEN
jgi:hypothetical protein